MTRLTKEGRRAQIHSAATALRGELLFNLVRAGEQPDHRETWLLLAAKNLCLGRALAAVLEDWETALPKLMEDVNAFAARHKQEIETKRAALAERATKRGSRS